MYENITVISCSLHRADKAKEGKAPISASVTVNKQRCHIALKQVIDVKNWNTGKGVAKGNLEEVKAVNNYLTQVRTALGNCYQQLQLKGKLLSAEAIKDAFLGTDEEVYTLKKLIDYHNR